MKTLLTIALFVFSSFCLAQGQSGGKGGNGQFPASVILEADYVFESCNDYEKDLTTLNATCTLLQKNIDTGRIRITPGLKAFMQECCTLTY